jgi:iron complex transport system substrate-binding protein
MKRSSLKKPWNHILAVRHILAALVLISLFLAACTPAAPAVPATPQSSAVEAKDADGNTVRLEKPASKVISLAPSNTEILFAVGAGAELIGRDELSNFPEDAPAIPSVGGSMGKFNMEEIARLQPDLLLASPLTPPETIKALEDLGSTVVVVPNPKDLEGLFANLTMVGQITGHGAEAEVLVASLRQRTEAVQQKVATAAEKPSVFYELDSTDPAKPWTAGPGSFIDLLINQAGGKNVAASLQGEYLQISQEELIVQNPDFIVLGDSAYGVTAESVAARPGWGEIAAVKNQHVFPFNDDLASRPGPRLIDGLEELAKILHPDLFK